MKSITSNEKIKRIELYRVAEMNRILSEEVTDVAERIAGLNRACDKAIECILSENEEAVTNAAD